jgi:hypothetical protein
MPAVRITECETAADVYRVLREGAARRKMWNQPKQQAPKPPPPPTPSPPPKEPEPVPPFPTRSTPILWMGPPATAIWVEMMTGCRPAVKSPEIKPYPLMADVIRAVARAYGFRSTDLKAARRDAWACQARHVSMLLCKLVTISSYPKIAKAHGKRDHTTVMYAIDKLAWLAPQLLALHTLADPPSAWAASAARLHPLPAMARTYIRRQEMEAQ